LTYRIISWQLIIIFGEDKSSNYYLKSESLIFLFENRLGTLEIQKYMAMYGRATVKEAQTKNTLKRILY
jgi:hypothetical protein